MYIFIIEQKQLFMNLVIIVLVAALIVGIVIAVNSKSKVEEVPEPLVNPNFKLDLEDPEAPVEAPVEFVPTQTIVSDEELEKLVEVDKEEKSPAVKKSAKAVAKTTAKAAPKKEVTKKNIK